MNVRGRGRAAARLVQRPRPCGQVVPARAARRLGIRRDDRNARLDQVAPVADALRVALAHQEHDRRGVGRAVVGQPTLPVGGQQLALACQCVDVIGERERDHVGRQAIDDHARLLPRAAVRLPDRDVLAGLLLPELRELVVVRIVELTRRVVRHVEQRHLGAGGGAEQRAEQGGGECQPGQGTGNFMRGSPAWRHGTARGRESGGNSSVSRRRSSVSTGQRA